MNHNDIEIIIPKELLSDFLGTFALDILHDSKKKGDLNNHKLYQLTDLLAYSIFLHNPVMKLSVNDLEMFVFKSILKYFVEVWKDNLSALGIMSPPDFTRTDDIYWKNMKTCINLPTESNNTASNTFENYQNRFIQLGNGDTLVERHNYLLQKNKVFTNAANSQKNNYYNTFKSPSFIDTNMYFNNIQGIITEIKQRLPETSKISLDMKTSAGLLRNITDPIGYITSIATYMDPGYNITGMNSIRRYSTIDFDKISTKFSYIIKIIVGETPVVLFKVSYNSFKENFSDKIERKNFSINILNETFQKYTSHSYEMAKLFTGYLKNRNEEKATFKDALEDFQNQIMTYIHNIENNDKCKKIENIYSVYKTLVNNPKDDKNAVLYELKTIGIFPKRLHENLDELIEWIFINSDNIHIRLSYVLTSIKNMILFNKEDIVPHDITPTNMINLMADIMYKYKIDQDKSINDLCFCKYQLTLLEDLIRHEEDEHLLFLIQAKWLKSNRGKLIKQITDNFNIWNKNNLMNIFKYKFYIEKYTKQVFEYCENNPHNILETKNNPTPFLNIPQFSPDPKLKNALIERLCVYLPEFGLKISQDLTELQTLMAFYMLLEVIFYNKNLIPLNINLKLKVETVVRNDIDTTKKTLSNVISKFTGDFGQLIWCIANSHIFSTEDNNISAMALILHRLKNKNIIINGTFTDKKWANIHGMGDGGCVDIYIKE